MDSHDRFEAIFHAHYRDVHRFALRRTDPAEAEEVANETFAIAWAKLGSVPEYALPWLYAVARKCLANRRRAAGRREGLAARLRTRSTPTESRDPAERLAERDSILRAFVELSESDREALRLVAWEELSLGDAARVAGVSRTAFAMRVHRARRRLAAELEGPAGPPAAELEGPAGPPAAEPEGPSGRRSAEWEGRYVRPDQSLETLS
jgi:RNA polymerase sigma factor (sigma-70 family)